jgi:hypothetical protein
MFVNNYKINISTISTGTTATTINIPITMEYQMIDQSELVERVFVDVETEKAINPIIDYERVRYLPLDLKLSGPDIPIDRVIYGVTFNSSGTTYGNIGFTDDDIRFQTESFKQTFLSLNFYDNENPFLQNLMFNVTVYARLTSADLVPSGSPVGIVGQAKKASEIPLTFILESPSINKLGFAEGYHLYDYKDELKIGEFKYLYMRASFKNAKTGAGINLMVQPNPLPIDMLVHELYTRYKLIRKANGYYYEIDNGYHGNSIILSANNVTYSTNTGYNDVTVQLYQINAL